MHYIYILQNIINNKVYIGQTVQPKKRFWRHKSEARTQKHKSPLYQSMIKYGIDNFTFQVIEEYSTLTEANNEETFWISFFNSTNREYGYNLSPGGQSPGIKHSKETIEKLRILSTNRTHSPESKKLISGTNNINAKLTNNQVAEIRKLYLTGQYVYSDLAIKFSVSNQAIKDLVNNKSYYNPLYDNSKIKNICISNKGGRSIIIDQNGVIYRSIIEAANLTKISRSSINRLLSGVKSQYKGYSFSYLSRKNNPKFI